MFNYSFSLFDTIFGDPSLFDISDYYIISPNEDKLRVKVPGLKASDIKVEVIKNQAIRITGENKDTKSKVYKVIKLDFVIDPKDVSATCRDGLLVLNFNHQKVKNQDVAEVPVIG